MFFFSAPQGGRSAGTVGGDRVPQHLRGKIVRRSAQTSVRRPRVGQQSAGDIPRRTHHVSAIRWHKSRSINTVCHQCKCLI